MLTETICFPAARQAPSLADSLGPCPAPFPVCPLMLQKCAFRYFWPIFSSRAGATRRGTAARLGVRPRSRLAGMDRWRAGISVRNQNRACRCRCARRHPRPVLTSTNATISRRAGNRPFGAPTTRAYSASSAATIPTAFSPFTTASAAKANGEDMTHGRGSRPDQCPR
jgi:hypothetical protein